MLSVRARNGVRKALAGGRSGPQHARMSQRVGQALSVVFVLGFLGWLGVVTRTGQDGDSRPSASPADPGIAAAGAPCSAPVRWYVAGVDPRFGVTREWVAEVAREAAAVWGAWEGRALLDEDPDGGQGAIPIRVAYDERQDRLDARVRRERSLRELDAALGEEADRLAGDRADFRSARTREARLGVRSSDSLDLLERTLDERALALDSAKAARDEAWDALARDFPTDRLEAAVFRVTEGSVSGAVHKEIRVFTFRDRQELVWTLAHEFGHALGVEHVADAAALMGGEQSRLDGVPLEAVLSAHDREAIRRRCGSAR